MSLYSTPHNTGQLQSVAVINHECVSQPATSELIFIGWNGKLTTNTSDAVELATRGTSLILILGRYRETGEAFCCLVNFPKLNPRSFGDVVFGDSLLTMRGIIVVSYFQNDIELFGKIAIFTDFIECRNVGLRNNCGDSKIGGVMHRGIATLELQYLTRMSVLLILRRKSTLAAPRAAPW